MRSRVLLAGILVATGCATARAPAPPPPTPSPPPPVEATLDVFEHALGVDGEWIVVGRYGRVWRPLHVAAGWQPYLYGEWIWTDDGWFWHTDEPWGWATYHYGRWAWDAALGWFWVPGHVWAPAWVAWRVGAGFVGWAPLYPEFTVWWVDAYPVVPRHWIFVPVRSFVAIRIELVAVPRARVPALVRSSRPAPPSAAGRPSRAPRLGGPPPKMVEEHVGRPLKPARIVAVPGPSDARRRIDRGSVPVYRPVPSPERARATGAAVPPRQGGERPEPATRRERR